jgi:phospholipid transport system substrate-binding protein
LAISPIGAAAGTPMAPAVASDAATQIIAAFDDKLLTVMRGAKQLGYDGRYRILAPVIDQTFDIPFMTRVVVGSAWNDWPADRRAQVTEAFRKFIISTYARRFDGFSGESFEITATQPVATGVLVSTKIMRPNDMPVALNYLMRSDQTGQYRVVDIFLTGTISELATRRSEFGEVLKHDGVDGLIAALAQKSDLPSTN